MPECTADEIEAFKKSFNQYSYGEHFVERVPIAIWSFNFPSFGPIDVNFDATRAWSSLIDDYLDTAEGVKNALTFHLLNGQIVMANKLVGLDPAAVELFHETIRRQLLVGYSTEQYNRALDSLHKQYTSVQLFELGTRFEKH
jgi:hypothetical protein